MKRRRTNSVHEAVRWRRRRRCAAMRACKQSIRPPRVSPPTRQRLIGRAGRSAKRDRHQFRSRGGDGPTKRRLPGSVCRRVPLDSTPTLNRQWQSSCSDPQPRIQLFAWCPTTTLRHCVLPLKSSPQWRYFQTRRRSSTNTIAKSTTEYEITLFRALFMHSSWLKRRPYIKNESTV